MPDDFRDLIAQPARRAILDALVPLVRRVFQRIGGVPRLQVPPEVRDQLKRDAERSGASLADARAADRSVFESGATTSSTIYNLLWALKVPGGSKKQKAELLQHLRHADVSEELLAHAAAFLAEDATHKQMMQARAHAHEKFERTVYERLQAQVGLQSRSELIEVLQDLEIFFFPFPASERAKVSVPDQIRRTRLLGMYPEDLEEAILTRREVLESLAASEPAERLLKDLRSSYRTPAKSSRRKLAPPQRSQPAGELPPRPRSERRSSGRRRSGRLSVSSAPSTLLISDGGSSRTATRQLKRGRPHEAPDVIEQEQAPSHRRTCQSEGSGLDCLAMESHFAAAPSVGLPATRRSSEPFCSLPMEPTPRRGSHSDIQTGVSLNNALSQPSFFMEEETGDDARQRLSRMTCEELRDQMRRHGLQVRTMIETDPAGHGCQMVDATVDFDSARQGSKKTKKRMVEMLAMKIAEDGNDDDDASQSREKEAPWYHSSVVVTPDSPAVRPLYAGAPSPDFLHPFGEDGMPGASTSDRDKPGGALGIENTLDDALSLEASSATVATTRPGERKPVLPSNEVMPEGWDWSLLGSANSTCNTVEMEPRSTLTDSADSIGVQWAPQRLKAESEDWKEAEAAEAEAAALRADAAALQAAYASQEVPAAFAVQMHGVQMAKGQEMLAKGPDPSFGAGGRQPWLRRPADDVLGYLVRSQQHNPIGSMQHVQPRSRGQRFRENLYHQELGKFPE